MHERIQDEQLRLLFGGLPSSLLVTLLLLALTILVSWGHVPTPTLLSCSAALVVVSAARAVLWLAYRRLDGRHVIAWSTLFFTGCIAAGTAWGATAVALFPQGDIPAQAYVAFLLAGVSAGAVTTLAADRRDVLGFVLPCVLPLAYKLSQEPDRNGDIMATMVVMYVAIIIAAGVRIHRQIHENIVLRLQAADRQLEREQSEAERERAAEELARLNERFKLATHSGDMGIWDWDIVTDTLVWDERTHEIYGTAQDLVPDMIYMMRTVHPDDLERIQQELGDALSGKQQLRTTFRIICPNGEERIVSASGLTLRNVSGRATRMTGLIWDITESQRVERLKNEFVATVSHELRTPLTSIRGSLGLVAAGVAGTLPERAAGLVNMALNNCERLTALINDILDMERLESDLQRFDSRRFDVADLVRRSLEDNAGYAQSLGVRFTTPEPLSHVDVLVDDGRFLQVMANLLSNACKFSPEGSAVEVYVRRHRGKVQVAVRDYGPGIPTDFQPRIFQKFSQADSSDSRSRTGTGLGLAISRAIVERLGGRISFETGPAGTSFYVELPEADTVEQTQDEAPSAQRQRR